MDALVDRLSSGADRHDLTLHRTQSADGTITERWQIDSEDDVRLFRQAKSFATATEVAAIGMLDPEPLPVRNTRHQVSETISLDKARDAWLASIKPRTLRRQHDQLVCATEVVTHVQLNTHLDGLGDDPVVGIARANEQLTPSVEVVSDLTLRPLASIPMNLLRIAMTVLLLVTAASQAPHEQSPYA